MKFRIDVACWARAVMNAETRWTFHGIRKNYQVPRGTRYPRGCSYLTESLLSDESYMNHLVEDEIDSLMLEDCYKEDWEEHCRYIAHREGQCPHIFKEQKPYEAAYSKLHDDESAKRQWISEFRFSWDDVTSRLEDDTKDPDWVEWFLKDHPVDGCYFGEDWYAIDDIVGFCPNCDAPQTGEMTPPVWRCHSCEYANIYEVSRSYNRPCYWPPGAPYPPYRGFDGAGLDSPL